MPLPAIARFFRKPIFSNYTLIFGVFFLATLAISLQVVFLQDSNNYKIFYYSLRHLVDTVNLYTVHPEEYFDHYHYAPSFAVLFAPLFVLPYTIGLFLWPFVFGVVFIWAVYKLPISKQQKVFVYWYTLQEYLTATGNTQTNPMIAAIPLLAFVAFEKKQPFWAAFFIMLGFNVKIYSLVAAALFILYPGKVKFILSSIFWGAVMAILPLLVTSPKSLLWQYNNWFTQLAIKTDSDKWSNVSIHRIIHQVISPDITTLAIIATGIVLFCTVYLHRKAFADMTFKIMLLASILIFQVIFQPAAESPTYIIAVTGVTVYWLFSPKATIDWILLIAVYILTVLSPTDFMPRFFNKEYVFPYVLKAWPVVLAWFRVLYLAHLRGLECSKGLQPALNHQPQILANGAA